MDAIAKVKNAGNHFDVTISSWYFPAVICQWFHIGTNPGLGSSIWSVHLRPTHALLAHQLERQLLALLLWSNGTRVEIRMGETGRNLLPTGLLILTQYTLKSEQNGPHFVDEIFKSILFIKTFCISSMFDMVQLTMENPLQTSKRSELGVCSHNLPIV